MFAVDNIERRVLIVEDEADVRQTLCEFLQENYECCQAESAEEALMQIMRQSFAVVISDIYLPGMTGLELIPQVSLHAPETGVIIISGRQNIDDTVTALRAGAFDYIAKPFDLLELETAVRHGVERYELKVLKRRYDLHLEQLVAERTTELDNALEEIENSYRATLKALVQALETRDFETHGHSERAVTFSLRLGYELGLDKTDLRALEFGALLHDIGKIGVPDAVLRKPAALNEAEWVKMRLHPLHGERILRGIDFLAGASQVVTQHHEKWDGSGYPLGLRGAEIDLKARIFAVVDAFDAIVSDRVYRRGKSHEEAVSEINRCAGTQFDPGVVAAFNRIPKTDWEQLRRRSLNRQPEQFSFQTVVAEMLNGHQAESMDFNVNSYEFELELP